MQVPLYRHLTLGVFFPDDQDPNLPWAAYAGEVEMTADEYQRFLDVVAETIRVMVARN